MGLVGLVGLLYLLRFYLLTVVLFLAAKVVFMLACHEAVAELTAADVWQVLRHGLSLDLSTALYFLILPFLLTIISIWVHVPRWIFCVYNAVVAVTMALAFVADTSLYPFWQFKLDASCLQYLSTPTEAMASVTTSYLLVRLLAVVIAAVVFFWLFRSVGIPGFRKSEIPTKKRSILLETLLYIALMPLMVIGIRGGVSESTTNIGQVYFSQNQFLNHSAVNPIFSFLYSLGHQFGDLSQYQFFDEAECQELIKDVYTTESVSTDTLLTTTRPHIVIILMESAGEEFAKAMPRLQQLKQEGVYFSKCYGNSWRTDRGTVSALSGYPSFPTISVMKMPEKSRTLPSIALTLQSVGYQTTYLYGGDINFTNMRSYLTATGWEQLVSKDDFPSSQQRTAQWGVRDDLTFNWLHRQITGSRPQSPILIGYSTLSSHEPWDVPVKKLSDEMLNAFAYLDDCLGQFVDQLRQTPQWDNLLLVILSDHGINYKQADNSHPLLKHHIPMLWLGGAVKEHRTVDIICNQTDLAATLLGQLQLHHDDFRFSRDVLSATYRYPTAVNNYSNAQMLVDSTGCILYDFDVKDFIVDESPDADRLLRLNKAILQVTTTDISQRR